MNVETLRSALSLALVSLVATGCAASAEDTSDVGTSVNTTVQPQTREHILLARQVGYATIAGSMGTSDGRIVVTDDAGGQKSLVVDRVVYTAGARVAETSRSELCEESRAGLASCTELSAAPPSTGAHECDADACWCEGPMSCVVMVISGACSGNLDCSEKACVCDR